MAWLLIRFLIFKKSASFPSVSRGCIGALYCLSCFTEGRFLTWPLTPRLAENLCFSAKHEEQQGRMKHLKYLGTTWQVVVRQILCTLKLNISAAAEGQMEEDRKVAAMLYRIEVWKMVTQNLANSNVTGENRRDTWQHLKAISLLKQKRWCKYLEASIIVNSF